MKKFLLVGLVLLAGVFVGCPKEDEPEWDNGKRVEAKYQGKFGDYAYINAPRSAAYYFTLTDKNISMRSKDDSSPGDHFDVPAWTIGNQLWIRIEEKKTITESMTTQNENDPKWRSTKLVEYNFGEFEDDDTFKSNGCFMDWYKRSTHDNVWKYTRVD
jgi:hypothetical protein